MGQNSHDLASLSSLSTATRIGSLLFFLGHFALQEVFYQRL